MLPIGDEDKDKPASFNKASRFKKELAISRSLALSPFRMRHAHVASVLFLVFLFFLPLSINVRLLWRSVAYGD